RRVAPRLKLGQAVRADQEVKLIARAVSVNRFQCLDAVMRARTGGFDLRHREPRMPRHGDPCHLQPMRHRGAAARLVRGFTGDHKPEPIETACFPALLREYEMTQVDWVERSAKKS